MVRFAPVALAALAVGLGGCGPKEPPSSAASGSSAAAPDAAPASSAVAAQMVNATILTNGCQALGATNARLAEKAMYQLVEGCASVPGGKAQFQATLEPGGRIEIGEATGHAEVVPICVLKHALVHKVPLKQPCRLDVKIEQTSVAMTRDGGT